MLHVHWIIYINGFDLLCKSFWISYAKLSTISTSLKNGWVQKTDYHFRLNYDKVKFSGEFHVIIYWSLWTFCNKCQNLQVIPSWQYLSPECFPDLWCHTMWWNYFQRRMLILIIVHVKYNFNLFTTVKVAKIHSVFLILSYIQKSEPKLQGELLNWQFTFPFQIENMLWILVTFRLSFSLICHGNTDARR